MPDFIPGRELAGAFYREVVSPLVGGRAHAAALIGFGSDVLGLDSPRSTDHGWGPRLQLFVSAADAAPLTEELARGLPQMFRGWPTHFGWDNVAVTHQVEIAELGPWLSGRLGLDPTLGLSSMAWLGLPQQRLAEVTQGPVFHDGIGTLTRARAMLAWYPPQVWLYVLASQWRRIAQEEAFVGRAAEAGDELGARLVAARLVRDLVRLCFLLERQYPPYTKWLGSAFARLNTSSALRPSLERALSAANPTDREAALADAYRWLGTQHNRLGLCDHVDSEPRRFHDRPYLVSAAADFVVACQSRIDDPLLSAALPVGTVDQFVDSTDVLTRPSTARALVAALLDDQTRETPT
jgi:hypothetical protein